MRSTEFALVAVRLVYDIFNSLLDLISPRRCGGCGRALGSEERCLCHRCIAELPRTNMHLYSEDNQVAQMYWGRIPILRATSFLYYTRTGVSQRFIYNLKYNGHAEYGDMIGRLMATEIMPSGFFDGIDYIIPVPLHPKKRRKRGYNQSEHIATGVSEVTGITLLTDAVERKKNTETQTRKSREERQTNMADAFKLSSKYNLSSCHILLIDDVVTTGATTVACAEAFRNIKDIRFSVLTLAMAK